MIWIRYLLTYLLFPPAYAHSVKTQNLDILNIENLSAYIAYKRLDTSFFFKIHIFEE